VTRRIDFVGLMLLAVALYASVQGYATRASSARWYAEAIEYNRAITRFLADERGRLAGRRVAVYGVAGLSPWSLSAGDYLAKLIGERLTWDVFVPKADIFYPLGPFAGGGTITVHEAAKACSVATDPQTLHLVISPRGSARFAPDCQQALALASPPPVIEVWGPASVTPAQRASGFNMYFSGEHLLAGLGVEVAGKETPMAYGRQGALMTTSVPPQPAASDSIPFRVLHHGRVVLSGEVAVR
jgi:hypothetical protein